MSKAQLESLSGLSRLDGQTLDLVLEGLDRAGQVTGLVGADAGSNDGARNTAGAAQSDLAGDEHVGGVLVLAQQGDVQQDGQRVGVGSEDGNLASVAVQGLGDLVGALLGLAVVGGRLEEVEDLLREGRVGQRPGSRLLVTRHFSGGCKEDEKTWESRKEKSRKTLVAKRKKVRVWWLACWRFTAGDGGANKGCEEKVVVA